MKSTNNITITHVAQYVETVFECHENLQALKSQIASLDARDILIQHLLKATKILEQSFTNHRGVKTKGNENV